MGRKKIKAIILAAGYSQRIKLKAPKQLVKIGSKPLLAYTLDAFERCRPISGIILTVRKKYLGQCRAIVKQYGYQKVEQLVIGGRTRQQSVFNALSQINDCDYVIIHDGARPFVEPRLILETVKAVKKFAAASCAVLATDTIVQEAKGYIGAWLKRNQLWQIQTPQAFKFSLILKAHQAARIRGIRDASDDAQLLQTLNKKVKLIPGSYKNIKITTLADLLLARKLAATNG